MRTIVWFRGRDLRVSDHAPLRIAADAGELLPLFLPDPCFFARSRTQEIAHRMQSPLESLVALDGSLRSRGSQLVVVRGTSLDLVPRLVQSSKADRVVAQSWVAPVGSERDRRIGEVLADRFELFGGKTLQPPGMLRSGSGQPYSVFSRFLRAWLPTSAEEKPLAAPRWSPPVASEIADQSVSIPSCEDLGITPNPRLQAGGERGAHDRLRGFLRGPGAAYARSRHRMDLNRTSRVSADRKFDTLSIRQVWSGVDRAPDDTESARAFRNELISPEFAHSTLWDGRELMQEPFRPELQGFPWRKDDAGVQLGDNYPRPVVEHKQARQC